MACLTHFSRIRYIQIKTQTDNTANDQTTIAETTTIEDKLSEQTTALEEIELSLFTGFQDRTALEDKQSLTVFSAIAVVCCISVFNDPAWYL